MIDTFNMHFNSAGTALELTLPANFTNSTITIPDLNQSSNRSSFNFNSISVSEVQRALIQLDCRKSAASDQIEPHFLKTDANVIAGPIASIFNLSLHRGFIPKSSKHLSSHF